MTKSELTKLKQKIADNLNFRKFAEELIGDPPEDSHNNHGETELEFICPFHDDTEASFNFNLDRGVWHCFGCGESGDWIDLYMELEGKDFWPAITELGQRVGIDVPGEMPDPSLTLQEYADAKGLDPDLLKSLGLESGKWYENDALRIPYYDKSGDLFRTRCRLSLYKRNGKDSRFKWYNDGEGQTLYGLWKLSRYGDKVLLVEGESDCHTLWNEWENYPVLGIPGKSNLKNFKRDWIEHLEGFEEITILRENDAKEEVNQAAATLASATDADIYILDLPTDDVSDLYQTDRHNFKELWSETVKDKVKFDFPREGEGDLELDVRQAKEPKKKNPGWKPEIESMEDVKSEKINWLWEPYIPKRKITILEGHPGVGKTFIALMLAARISQGEQFLTPGVDKSGHPDQVLYMTAEDGLGDTLKPRLEAMGANVKNIHSLRFKIDEETGEKRFISFHEDIEYLSKAIKQVDPALVVADPLQGFLGSDVNAHRANEVRPVLAGLSDIAEEFDTAFMLIRHLTKSSRPNSISRGLGSIDFAAHARSILMAGEHPDKDNEFAITQNKGNLAEKGPSLGYRLKDNKLIWTGESHIESSDITAPEPTRDEKSAKEEAEDFLKAYLSEGPQYNKDVKTEAKSLDIAGRTLRRAKKSLGVEHFRDGRQVYWRLPEEEEGEEVPF